MAAALKGRRGGAVHCCLLTSAADRWAGPVVPPSSPCCVYGLHCNWQQACHGQCASSHSEQRLLACSLCR